MAETKRKGRRSVPAKIILKKKEILRKIIRNCLNLPKKIIKLLNTNENPKELFLFLLLLFFMLSVLL